MSSSKPQSDRIDAALVEYFERVDAGEVVDVNEFMLKHADIADQLASFLNDNQSVERAMDASKTAHFSHSNRPSASKGLRIACPHCSNHVELLVDTPYESVTCRSCGSAFSLVDREEATRMAAPLKRIGRFDLISRLGVGGFGSVWKAYDRELDRTVAVKIPRKGQLSTDEVEQFFREARSAAQLKHPNIVPVHEVGRDGDTIFIVCDLVRGVELSDWLTASRATFRESVELCRTVARALHHAHQSGIVHRDLKPSNIMIDGDGEPHLMDFGLAKREIGEITMTVDGQILGTPAYMSPEQASGHSHWTDRRTDIYSLGVIFYRMLTGELPFRGNAQMQVFQRLKEDPASPRKLNRHIPRDLETICLKCLERDPNKRYPSANAVAEEFDRFLSSMPITARPLSKVERMLRWGKRKPWLASTLALGLVLAIAGPIAAIHFARQEQLLANELVKYDKLVAQAGTDGQRLKNENASLREEVQLLASSADPWQTWRPSAELGPRRQFLDEIYRQQFAGAVTRLESQELPLWEIAIGRIALGVLAYASSHAEEAANQFNLAEKLLRPLVMQSPNDPDLIAALAACCENQALLKFNRSPSEAVESLQEASRLYAQLTALDDANHLHYRVDRAEAEMRIAVSDKSHAATHAKTAMDEMDNLAKNWPEDPKRLYGLVMHLVQDEAAGAPLALPQKKNP